MSMPSRNCSSPKRTIRGTTCTPNACASEGEISEVLSVTRWITLLEREHVRVVLLSPRLELELRLRMRGAQAGDQRLRLFLADLGTAVHRHQLWFHRLRFQHRVDDREVIAPDLGDRSEEHTSELQSPCNLVCR